jgi:hypothetical protein
MLEISSFRLGFNTTEIAQGGSKYLVMQLILVRVGDDNAALADADTLFDVAITLSSGRRKAEDER